MFTFSRLSKFIAVASLLVVGTYVVVASANHSWGGYHWSRTSNPLSLTLGDNLTSIWDPYLGLASSDWTVSEVLNTAIVPGKAVRSASSQKDCSPATGKVEVCNKAYGKIGWLGVAQIWVNGLHITKGSVKMNDSYFTTAPYNTPAWRKLVMCQEVGHTFGLDHQDEIFTNPNLGTCMDYTNDPDGTLANPDQLSNEHPNQHDYDELGIIYSHLDAFAALFGKQSAAPASVGDDSDASNPSDWGKVIRKSGDGHSSLHEKDLGNGHKVFTFVIWANQSGTE